MLPFHLGSRRPSWMKLISYVKRFISAARAEGKWFPPQLGAHLALQAEAHQQLPCCSNPGGSACGSGQGAGLEGARGAAPSRGCCCASRLPLWHYWWFSTASNCPSPLLFIPSSSFYKGNSRLYWNLQYPESCPCREHCSSSSAFHSVPTRGAATQLSLHRASQWARRWILTIYMCTHHHNIYLEC